MVFFSPKGEPLQDPYALLGLPFGSSDDDVAKSYKRLMLRLHPDKQPSTQSPDEAEENSKRFHDVMDAKSFLLDGEHLAAKRAWESKVKRQKEEAAMPRMPPPPSRDPPPSSSSSSKERAQTTSAKRDRTKQRDGKSDSGIKSDGGGGERSDGGGRGGGGGGGRTGHAAARRADARAAKADNARSKPGVNVTTWGRPARPARPRPTATSSGGTKPIVGRRSSDGDSNSKARAGANGNHAARTNGAAHAAPAAAAAGTTKSHDPMRTKTHPRTRARANNKFDESCGDCSTTDDCSSTSDDGQNKHTYGGAYGAATAANHRAPGSNRPSGKGRNQLHAHQNRVHPSSNGKAPTHRAAGTGQRSKSQPSGKGGGGGGGTGGGGADRGTGGADRGGGAGSAQGGGDRDRTPSGEGGVNGGSKPAAGGGGGRTMPRRKSMSSPDLEPPATSALPNPFAAMSKPAAARSNPFSAIPNPFSGAHKPTTTTTSDAPKREPKPAPSSPAKPESKPPVGVPLTAAAAACAPSSRPPDAHSPSASSAPPSASAGDGPKLLPDFSAFRPAVELLESKYRCPLTGRVMVDPMSDFEGNSYEREAILEHLKVHSTSPVTGNPLYPMHLTPNSALREKIRYTLKLKDCLESLQNGKERLPPQPPSPKPQAAAPKPPQAHQVKYKSLREAVDGFIADLNSGSPIVTIPPFDDTGATTFSYLGLNFVLGVPDGLLDEHVNVQTWFDHGKKAAAISARVVRFNAELQRMGLGGKLTLRNVNGRQAFTLTKSMDVDNFARIDLRHSIEYFVEMSVKLHNVINPTDAKKVDKVRLTNENWKGVY